MKSGRLEPPGPPSHSSSSPALGPSDPGDRAGENAPPVEVPGTAAAVALADAVLL